MRLGGLGAGNLLEWKLPDRQKVRFLTYVTLKLRSLGIYAAIARLSFDTSIRVDLSLEGGG
ncbi:MULTISPECIES: hypothetical protein [unclassified Microcoleus]|uniref:hypothetical protein n=1 Tax=unclassified Microcoleus TaxID=2642155 RepID=UPI002FD1EE4F